MDQDDQTDARLSIGAFARRSRLSPKALRLYDERGLLAPADVDQYSGYRRYRESQLKTARLIAMLRRLEMPLSLVSDVINAPDPEAAEILASFWASVERRVAGQRHLVEHLRNGMSNEKEILTMYTIQEREVPEQLVLIEQRHVVAADLPQFIANAMSRLIKAAASIGGQQGPAVVVYHGEVNEDSDGPVEVCIPVDAERGAGTTAAKRLEPSHREAFTRITKAQVEFPQILSAYDAVAQWLEAASRPITGAPREIYFVDFGEAAATDEVCDIAFPIN